MDVPTLKPAEMVGFGLLPGPSFGKLTSYHYIIPARTLDTMPRPPPAIAKRWSGNARSLPGNRR